MKTNRIYAVGEKAILELGFQKTLDYPDEIWVRLCQKHYPDEKITKVVDAKTVEALADIPTKDVLIATVIGSIQAPLYSLAYTLQCVVDKASEEAPAEA